MTKQRVCIAYPSKNGLPPYSADTLFRVMQTPHPKYVFEPCLETGHHGIHFARNIIADYVMREGYDKLIELDADMAAKPEDIYRWADLLDEPDVDALYAPYCGKRSGPCKWMVVKKPGAEVQPNRLLELDFGGTGVHCVRVEKLRQMVGFYPEREFVYEDDADGKQKKMTELYPMGLVGPNTPEGRLRRIAEVLRQPDSYGLTIEAIDNIITNVHPGESRLLGEDYHFSHLARKAGLRLWCDMTHVIGHVGDAIYPISTDALSAMAVIPSHTGVAQMDKY